MFFDIGLSDFFFKQKTADEMRISGWSSDVCSSDLPRLVDATSDASEDQRLLSLAIRSKVPERNFRSTTKSATTAMNRAARLLENSDHGIRRSIRSHASSGMTARLIALYTFSNELGRQSCRERVCMYV